MEGNIWLMLLLQAVLIACNAVFACAEIAVISSSDAKLEKLADDGDKRAKRLLKLTSTPAKFLATIQVAITLAGFLGSAFAAENFSGLLVDWFIEKGVTIPAATLDAIMVVLITLALSFVTLIFGELVPKRLAQRKSEEVALGLSGLVCFISKLFAPLVWLLTVSTNGVLRLLGVEPNASDNDVSEEDIHDIVDSAVKSGTIADDERDFIQNVFEFDDLTAGEIAVHRTDAHLLWLDETDEEWNAMIHETCHMFYPVCRESADDVVGVLYLKDYIKLELPTREQIMEKAVKTPYFVPESVKADVLFRNMKTGGKTFAVVLDEYGGMRGILTMNDLISRLVGDYGGDEADESGNPTVYLEKISDTTWKLVGNVDISDIAEELDVELPEDDFDTFSGMVFSEFGSIPEDGETFEVAAWGLLIKVTEVLEHQVASAELTLLDPPTSGADDDKDE